MPAPTITHPALLSIHYPKPPQAGREHQAPLPPPNIPEDSAVVQNPHERIQGLLRMTNRFPVYGTSNTGRRGSQEACQHVSTSPVPGDLSASQLVSFRMRTSLLTRRRSRRADQLTSGARRAQRADKLSRSGSLSVCARAPDDLLLPSR